MGCSGSKPTAAPSQRRGSRANAGKEKQPSASKAREEKKAAETPDEKKAKEKVPETIEKKIEDAQNKTPEDLHSEALGYIKEGEMNKAIEPLEEAANGGHVPSCSEIASLFFDQEKGVRNYQKGFTYAEMGADKGDGKSMHLLGKAYEEGKGVAQNKAKAQEYYQKAVGAGFGEAQTDLDRLNEMGDDMGSMGEREMEIDESDIKVMRESFTLNYRIPDENGENPVHMSMELDVNVIPDP
eukprot:Nk52_evm22s215 gene=Nk52_evmTU22s215